MTEQTKDEMQQDLFICRRTVGGGEYEGATCYYVYTPIESYVSPPVPDDVELLPCDKDGLPHVGRAIKYLTDETIPYLRSVGYHGSLKDIKILIRHVTNIRAALQSTRSPPIDTIRIKREVLQGVREALKRVLIMERMALNPKDYPEAGEYARTSLASLDAVLSEGE